LICQADAIRFPFLKESSIYAKDIVIKDFLEDKEIIKKIDNYLYDIFSKKYHDYEVIDIDTALKRFIGCVLIINQIKKDRLTHRFAKVESEHYIQQLRIIYNKDTSFSKENFYTYFDMIYTNLYGKNDVRKTKENLYAIKIPKYLSIIRDKPELKLINQAVLNGYVIFNLETLFELLMSGIKTHIVSKIEKMSIVTDLDLKRRGVKVSKFHPPSVVLPKEFISLIKKYEYLDTFVSVNKTIKGHDKNYDKEKLVIDCKKGYPPCVSYLIDKLNDDNKVSHFQRLTLASYLNKAGKSQEEIVQVFSNAPNFDDKVTRYQINQIVDSDYMPASCERINEMGFCFRNNKCGLIKNPIQYL